MKAFSSPFAMKVLATATSFPGTKVSNEQLCSAMEKHCGKRLSRKAHSLSNKLGIETRYLVRSFEKPISKPTITAPELSRNAVSQALQEAGLSEPDYLISHTTTPHSLLPGNAAWLCHEMKLQIPYMELRQACTGFANALQIANSMLHSQILDTVLITSCETGSIFFNMDTEFIDTEQLVNFVQMGDGAAAVLLTRADEQDDCKIDNCFIGHQGLEGGPGFELKGGGTGNIVCEKGFPVFKHHFRTVRAKGVSLFIKGIEVVRSAGYELDDFAFIIPHQANGHIDVLLAEHLGISPEKIVNDAKQFGNLGSVAIWISFDQLRRSGRLKSGDKVLILGAEATQFMYGGFIYTH